MFAFSIHEIFEGIAFGLIGNINKAIPLAIGILIHETCANLSIGAGFAKTNFTSK